MKKVLAALMMAMFATVSIAASHSGAAPAGDKKADKAADKKGGDKKGEAKKDK